MACGFHPETEETARNMWVRSPGVLVEWGRHGWKVRGWIGNGIHLDRTVRRNVTRERRDGECGHRHLLRELVSRAAHDDVARRSESNGFATGLRYARVRLGRFGAEDLAQDVAQEVCMAVVAAVPTYEERGLPFEAFVYRIVPQAR